MSQERSHPPRDRQGHSRPPESRGDFLRARDEQRRGFFDSALLPAASRTADPKACADSDQTPKDTVHPEPARGTQPTAAAPAAPARFPARPVHAPEHEHAGAEDGAASNWVHGRRAPDVAPERPVIFGEPGEPEDGELRVNRRSSCRYTVAGVAVMVGWPTASDPSLVQASRDGLSREWRSQVEDREVVVNPAAPTPRPEGLVRHPGLLIDISQNGLCISLDQPAPADRRLWIGFMVAGKTSWVEVILRSLSASTADGFQLRFSFVSGCPYEVYSTLVLNGNARPCGAGYGEKQNAG